MPRTADFPFWLHWPSVVTQFEHEQPKRQWPITKLLADDEHQINKAMFKVSFSFLSADWLCVSLCLGSQTTRAEQNMRSKMLRVRCSSHPRQSRSQPWRTSDSKTLSAYFLSCTTNFNCSKRKRLAARKLELTFLKWPATGACHTTCCRNPVPTRNKR